MTNEEISVSAILLAAGLSSRMNGQNKMLLPFQQTTIIQHTYNQLVQSDVEEIIVIGGGNFQDLHTMLDLGEDDSLIHNANYVQGMTSSIQSGVERAGADAYMICLGDMPMLKYAHYVRLIAFYKDNVHHRSECIIVPKVNGHRANPVIFSKHFRKQILDCTEPNGCKSVIQLNQEAVIPYETDDKAYLMDIDTPEDYKRIIDGLE